MNMYNNDGAGSLRRAGKLVQDDDCKHPQAALQWIRKR